MNLPLPFRSGGTPCLSLRCSFFQLVVLKIEPEENNMLLLGSYGVPAAGLGY